MLNARLMQSSSPYSSKMPRPPVFETGGQEGCRCERISSGERRLWRLGRLRALRTLGGRAVAALGHELIEFGSVLGKAKPLQEFLEFALLVFEPAQRFGAVFIEGAVATRRRGAPPVATFHLGPHAIHLALHALHLRLPVCLPVAAVPIRASHSAAP